MNIIFDENIPLPLKLNIPSHAITTVQEQGWAGIENGRLIEKIDKVFDILILADKNLRYQQNLKDRQLAIIEVPTNRWPILKNLAPRIIEAINSLKPGDYIEIQMP